MSRSFVPGVGSAATGPSYSNHRPGAQNNTNIPNNTCPSEFLSRIEVIRKLQKINQDYPNEFSSRFNEIAIFNLYYTNRKEGVTNPDYITGQTIFYEYNDTLINEDTMTTDDIERINKNIIRLNRGDIKGNIISFLNKLLLKNKFNFCENNFNTPEIAEITTEELEKTEKEPEKDAEKMEIATEEPEKDAEKMEIAKITKEDAEKMEIAKITEKMKIDKRITEIINKMESVELYDTKTTTDFFNLMTRILGNGCDYFSLPATRDFIKTVTSSKIKLQPKNLNKLKIIADFLKQKPTCDTTRAQDKKKWNIPDGSFSLLMNTIQKNGLDDDNKIDRKYYENFRSNAAWGENTVSAKMSKMSKMSKTKWFGGRKLRGRTRTRKGKLRGRTRTSKLRKR